MDREEFVDELIQLKHTAGLCVVTNSGSTYEIIKAGNRAWTVRMDGEIEGGMYEYRLDEDLEDMYILANSLYDYLVNHKGYYPDELSVEF